MKRKNDIEKVECVHCNTVFSTDKPTFTNVECSCGAIYCDVTLDYIRVLNCERKDFVYSLVMVIDVVVEKAKKGFSGFAEYEGVCVGAGDTIEEFKEDFKLAFELHVEGLIDDGYDKKTYQFNYIFKD